MQVTQLENNLPHILDAYNTNPTCENLFHKEELEA